MSSDRAMLRPPPPRSAMAHEAMLHARTLGCKVRAMCAFCFEHCTVMMTRSRLHAGGVHGPFTIRLL